MELSRASQVTGFLRCVRGKNSWSSNVLLGSERLDNRHVKYVVDNVDELVERLDQLSPRDSEAERVHTGLIVVSR